VCPVLEPAFIFYTGRGRDEAPADRVEWVAEEADEESLQGLEESVVVALDSETVLLDNDFSKLTEPLVNHAIALQMTDRAFVWRRERGSQTKRCVDVVLADSA
jgi:hypothetical protein